MRHKNAIDINKLMKEMGSSSDSNGYYTYNDFDAGAYFLTLSKGDPIHYFKPGDDVRICHSKIEQVLEYLYHHSVYKFFVIYKSVTGKEGKTRLILQSPNKNVLIRLRDDIYDHDGSEDYKFDIYSTEESAIKDLRDILKPYLVINKTGRMISLITTNISGGLSLSEFKAKNPKIDIELNYGKDFLEIDKFILGKLSTQEKGGLVLFHGEPGTGKTYYIRSLIWRSNRKVVFLPNNLVGELASPRFVKFMINDINDSLLIIEDAEQNIESRSSGQAYGIENILNLTDGLLGDCLNISIVATFNTKLANIDRALLRKGRLIANHEFGTLPIESAQKLINKLKLNHVATEEMTLAQIYNLKDISPENSAEISKKIGFAS